jgi:hypothetical protein
MEIRELKNQRRRLTRYTVAGHATLFFGSGSAQNMRTT